MLPITLTLPWPPSVNKYWRHTFVNRRFTVLLSAEARRYKDNVLYVVVARHAQLHLSCPVAVHISLYPRNRMTRDIDNYSKGLLDALTYAGVWQDDKLVRYMTVRMCDPVPQRGKCVVTICAYEAPEV